MGYVIVKFKSIFSLQLIIFMICIGIFMIFYETYRLRKGKLAREEKMAKITGIVYTALGVAAYIATKFV